MTGKGHGEKKTAKGEAVIAALLSCQNMASAAKKAGIGLTTMHRWLTDPTFNRRYQEARKQVLEVAIGRLEQSTTEAVTTLCRNMKGRAPASQQVAAARAVLDHTIKVRHEHSGPGGGPIPVGAVVLGVDELERLDDHDLDSLRSILGKLGGADIARSNSPGPVDADEQDQRDPEPAKAPARGRKRG